jgi:hypothetical protein
MSYEIDTQTYDGEKVVAKTYSTQHAQYKILNRSKDSDDEYGTYRSVIVDPDTNKIMCISPPKSIPNESFYEEFPDKAGVVATEIIEGTMLNLFYDHRIASWEIASKGAVGGNYWYFRTQYSALPGASQLSFRDMFVDALCSPPGTALNDIATFGLLDKACVYSFVIQHPNNHIVMPIQNPAVYLVAVYHIDADQKVTQIDVDEQYLANTTIQLPRKRDIVYETNEFGDYTDMGTMLLHRETGKRTKLLNPTYVETSKIRGNNPNLQYHYLTLFRIGKVKEYLEVFPMYRNMFYAFHQQSAKFIRAIHSAYVTYYVKKQGNDVKIEKSIFRHIHKLHHEVYLPSLANGGARTLITCKQVADYFNAMDPKEQIYHLNYSCRKLREPATEQSEELVAI